MERRVPVKVPESMRDEVKILSSIDKISMLDFLVSLYNEYKKRNNIKEVKKDEHGKLVKK